MRFNWLRRPKTATAKQELGARGEKAAAKYLRRHGYKILLRGFRSRSGEIDIVCRHKDWLVFVEVKTRESEQFGAPSEAVDERKQRHITKVALDYLRLLDNPPIKFRFDIVEVLMRNDARKPNAVSLIQNAFDLSEPYIY
ncbi:MAG: YraN family protein [Verrucomicrobiia bacterium]|jgi:putative endonuclease